MIQVATWNVHGGLDSNGSPYDFGAIISRQPSDVVALQELNIPRQESDAQYGEKLAYQTGFEDAFVLSLSDSHHDSRARLAIALLGRRPLIHRDVISLPNPSLSNAHGDVSHDRAVLKAELALDKGVFEVACVHMVSFFHFGLYNEADKFPAVWQALSSAITPRNGAAESIVMGDFNSHKRYNLISQLKSGEMRSSFSYHPSKRSNSFDDDILVSSSLKVQLLERIKTESDHDLLRALVLPGP